jgi:tellurite methyltransferase
MMSNDTNYWKSFYNKKQLELIPSDFCLYIMDYFKSNTKMKILDAGCGNGRDSYHLALNHEVTGIDISYMPEHKENCVFEINDFTICDKSNYDMIYSRFTFHSITNEQHEIFIKSIKKGTMLCIETRSNKGKDSTRYYGDDHYRNFTDMEYLKGLLTDNEFDILYMEENENFAKYMNENPICIRVICKKM